MKGCGNLMLIWKVKKSQTCKKKTKKRNETKKKTGKGDQAGLFYNHHSTLALLRVCVIWQLSVVQRCFVHHSSVMGIQQKGQTLKSVNIRVKPEFSAKRSQSCCFHRFIAEFSTGKPHDRALQSSGRRKLRCVNADQAQHMPRTLLSTALTENVNCPQ